MKCQVSIQVTFVIHVAGSWPDETPIAKVQQQAATAARSKVSQLDPGPENAITIAELRVLDVTLTQEPPF